MTADIVEAAEAVKGQAGAGVPALEAAQQQMLSRLVAVQWQFGGAMWELRAARAEARCDCCKECRQGAGKWLTRQEKERERSA